MASRRAQLMLEIALEEDGDVAGPGPSKHPDCESESSYAPSLSKSEENFMNAILTKDKLESLGNEENVMAMTKKWVSTQGGTPIAISGLPRLVDYSPSSASRSSLSTECKTPRNKSNVSSARQILGLCGTANKTSFPFVVPSKPPSNVRQVLFQESSVPPSFSQGHAELAQETSSCDVMIQTRDSVCKARNGIQISSVEDFTVVSEGISISTPNSTTSESRRSRRQGPKDLDKENKSTVDSCPRDKELNTKKTSNKSESENKTREQVNSLKPDAKDLDNVNRSVPNSDSKDEKGSNEITSNSKYESRKIKAVNTKKVSGSKDLTDRSISDQHSQLGQGDIATIPYNCETSNKHEDLVRKPSSDLFASFDGEENGEALSDNLTSIGETELFERRATDKSSNQSNLVAGYSGVLRKRKPNKYVDDESSNEDLFFNGSDVGDEWVPDSNKKRCSSVISNESSDDAPNDSGPPSIEEHNDKDSENDEGNDHEEPIVRKPNTRKARAERSRLRNSGKQYIGASGKVRKQRTCLPLKKCKAKWCQISKLSEDDRQAIFDEYWALGSYNKRTQYVSSRILKKDTKTTKTKGSNNKVKNRTCTLEYSFIFNEERIIVSKQCFLLTLNENDRFIRGLMDRRSNTALVEDDARGKHPPPNKLPESVYQEVVTHIHKFPAYVSHYSRRHTQQLYLGQDLNVAIMHKLYLEEGGTKISYSKYLEIFNGMSPRLKFKTPKLDTCTTCDTLQNGISHAQSPEEKETLEDQLKLHVNKADFAYTCKKEDKITAKASGNTTSTIVFDLEQVLPCPYLSSGNVFYLRQLSVYNLTVFATESKEAFNFMWHEGISGRGADEISSCLMAYFNDYLPRTVKHVIMYSDTCSGQNRNSIMLAALSFTVQNHPSIEIIDQKFLVSGHTHLECDQVHHQIESRKKKTSIPLHHPQNYFDLVREAGPSSRKYKVKEMKRDDFCSLERSLKGNAAPLVWRKNDTDGNQFLFSEAEWFRFQSKCPGIIQYKKSLHQEEPFLTLNWKRKRQQPLPEIEIYQKRKTPCPISVAKKENLISVLNQINPLYHDFYNNLVTDNELQDEDPDLPPEYEVSSAFEFD